MMEGLRNDWGWGGNRERWGRGGEWILRDKMGKGWRGGGLGVGGVGMGFEDERDE